MCPRPKILRPPLGQRPPWPLTCENGGTRGGTRTRGGTQGLHLGKPPPVPLWPAVSRPVARGDAADPRGDAASRQGGTKGDAGGTHQDSLRPPSFTQVTRDLGRWGDEGGRSIFYLREKGGVSVVVVASLVRFRAGRWWG